MFLTLSQTVRKDPSRDQMDQRTFHFVADLVFHVEIIACDNRSAHKLRRGSVGKRTVHQSAKLYLLAW